jgi:hypothetical protein
MRSLKLTLLFIALNFTLILAQNPTAFSCNGSDGFGYYISSLTENNTTNDLTYSSSRLSKIVTSTGVRTALCTPAQIGVSLNALAFNPHDNFLYAVSRYDASQFSGKLFRIGANCQRFEIPVTGAIQKFSTNNKNTIDAAGGNIGSGTFDLDNNYYVNTSFTNVSSTGFTNKLQKIRINGNSAIVLSTATLTCASCVGEVQINDLIFDEASGKLLGSNFVNQRLYSINPGSGVMTPIGTGTTANSAILGMYKNRDGLIRAIAANGNIYSVNVTSGIFSLITTATDIVSRNADAASGCYAPPSISGHLFLDQNRLNDNTVNGTGTNLAGSTPIFANLIQGGLVVKSVPINPNGTYQFLGLFSGTYEVQISATLGTKGLAPPAQNLPASHVFTGDHIGAGVGSDGSPNGKLTVTVSMGVDVTEVNFGIDAEVVLPVNFKSFIAIIESGRVNLEWVTENEMNHNYFEIERKTNSVDFYSIGRVSAKNNNTYSFIDRDVNGKVYYRLKQIDFDGNINYSKIVMVTLNDSRFISVYPTIMNELLNIETDADQRFINIYSITGCLYMKQTLEFGTNQIFVSDLPKGVMIYVITDKNGSALQRGQLIKL